MKILAYGLMAVSWIGVAHAELIDHSTQHYIIHQVPIIEPPSTQTDNHHSWFDERHEDTKTWLNRTARHMDRWFGKSNPDKPAYANLRVMMDFYDDKYDGTSIKPKIRGKIRLPTLEDRLSVIVGNDDLEYYDNTGWHVDSKDNKDRFDRQQTRTDNSSFALRFSKWKHDAGITTDADIGMRPGNDLYGRLRAEKLWQKDHGNARLEQIYRYGTKSEHFLRTNYIHNHHYSNTRSLTNHTYLEYSHDGYEDLIIGNTLYQTHSYPTALGERTLSYGANVYARIDENAYPNSYGVFINYRQPIWRHWLFAQGEMTYYNHKIDQKDHRLATFLRLEAQF